MVLVLADTLRKEKAETENETLRDMKAEIIRRCSG